MTSERSGERTPWAGLRWLRGAVAALALVLCAPTWSTAATQDGLTIPASHPRLWWTPARLAQAKQWYAQNPFTPSTDDALGNAFRHLMTGEATYGQRAISLLMGFAVSEVELNAVASDTYRWNDWPAVVFDWTYDLMTPAERTAFTGRYNRYVDIMRQKSWGGPGLEANNYYWGYWRNELNWAIASYYDNAMAPTFLDHALVTRWRNSFLPYAVGKGKGGVTQEGTQYGRYMLGYPVIPMTTAGLLGRDLLGETNFYKEAVFYLIYATTPAPTQGVGRHEVFPFNDDEFWFHRESATSWLCGDFMRMAATRWRDLPVGQYARRWLNVVKPSASGFVKAVDPGGAERPFSELPLDYYAPGGGFLYARNAWSEQATVVNWQLGVPSGVGHAHLDAGTFQIRRGRQWLSRETVGYSDSIAGYGGGAVDTSRPVAHNALLFNGLGQANAYAKGAPKIKRLESRAEYTYANVDLSDAYRAVNTSHPDRDDNPYASHAEREFVFVRPLETLVILDRLESSSEKVPAEEVAKTFLLHFEQQPTVQGANTVVGVNGGQALQVTTLLPAAPSYRVVQEGDFLGSKASPIYQYRLQVDTKGARESQFLHVLQAKDAAGPNVAVGFAEDGTTYTVTLQHPTAGTAVLVFNKGLTVTGGRFGYSPSGLPSALTPFIDRVQGIEVTDSGPVWEGGSVPPPVPDPTPPSVTLTAPADGAVVAGTTAVTADASDNLGVARVQFRLDGAALGAADVTSPYSASWDTETASNGPHTLTAVATDLAGNSSTASAVTATVANTPPPTIPPDNPVSLYLEAESGTVVSAFQAGSDPRASGGTYLATPAGIAELAQGTTEVRIPVTIPATGPYYLWARILGPADDQDALYVGVDGGFDRVFPAQLNAYEWVRVEKTHLSGNVVHQLTAGPHELAIGHAEPQARADVLLVTNDPTLVPTGAPNEPPIPPAANRPPKADAGADQATTSGSSVQLDGRGSTDPDGDSLTHAWQQTAGPSVALSGAATATASFTAPVVTALTDLRFTLTVTDGKLSGTDIVTVSVMPEPAGEPPEDPPEEAADPSPGDPPEEAADPSPGEPPVITELSLKAVTQSTLTLLVTTDRPSRAHLDYGSSMAYSQMAESEKLRRTHTFTVNGLAAGSLYYFRVTVRDVDDETSAASDRAFATMEEQDLEAPGPISDLAAADVSDLTTALTWTAPGDDGNRGTVTAYEVHLSREPLTEAVAPFIRPLDGPPQPKVAGGRERLALEPLEPATAYFARVRARDETGTWGPWSNEAAFTTRPPIDRQSPHLAAVQVTALDIDRATITWTTDEPADSRLEYGKAAGTFERDVREGGLTKAHTVVLTGLNPATRYFVRLGSADAAGNLTDSDGHTFVTLTPDTSAPSRPGNLQLAEASPGALTLQWAASNDDRGVTGYTVFREGAEIATVSTPSHRDTGLKPGTAYTYSVRARDAAGNVSATSVAVTLTTSALPPPPPPPPPVTPPTIYRVQAESVVAGRGKSGLRIRWQTDRPATSKLSYRLHGYVQWIPVPASPTPATEHQVVLPFDTDQAHLLWYIMYAVDAAGKETVSELYLFRAW